MKTILLTGLVILSRINLNAQVEGPLNPNSFSNSDLPGYNQQWTDISNVGSSDENYASFGNLTGGVGSHTDYLVAYDFNFQIPAATIIDGIEVEVECSDPNSRTSDYSVRIMKAGYMGGTEKATGTAYPVSDNLMTYGGTRDLWGETWDYQFIDNYRFGVAIAAQRNSDDDVATLGRVNNIRITVYYHFITLPVTLTSFTVTKGNNLVQLKWNTVSESNIVQYEPERSSDGRNFYSLSSIPALNIQAASYNFIDNNPLPGISYYRLKIEGMDHYSKYSTIIPVSFLKEKSAILYPSPWQKGTELNITNDNNEKLIIYFFNAGGQVLSAVITKTNSVPTESLSLPKGLTPYKIYNSKMELIGSGRIVIL